MQTSGEVHQSTVDRGVEDQLWNMETKLLPRDRSKAERRLTTWIRSPMSLVRSIKEQRGVLPIDKVGPEDNDQSKRPLIALSIAALGVVYGDIGTSPLYALKQCFHPIRGIAATPENVLGVLSLIVWSLIVVVSIKYLLFILKADNKGEGGIIALVALLNPWRSMPGSQRHILMLMGLFGAALLYGDGTITPAISVLSAVEGLIPSPIDQNPCAHWRSAMEMIRQG
jgi:hypothetical protein